MSADTAETPEGGTVACGGWDGSECEGTVHCPPRCPRFVDEVGARWTIHPADEGDAGALAEMYEGFGTRDRARGLPPVDRRRRADWIDATLTEGHAVVAERGGEAFGHAAYTPADAARPELAVFVHPDAQDRGVGTELCRRLIADAAAADREGLELYVSAGNRAARAVYRTVGFRTRSRDGDLRMTLSLDDPIATEVRWPPVVREGSIVPGEANARRRDPPGLADHNR